MDNPRFRALLPITLLTLIFMALSACGPELSDDPLDGSVPGVVDTDGGDTENGPTGTTTSGVTSGSCVYQQDCADDEVCANAECVEAPSCGAPSTWPRCVTALDELEEDLGRFATCENRMCRVGCTLDSDCPEGSSCSDFGKCREWDGEVAERSSGVAQERLRGAMARRF